MFEKCGQRIMDPQIFYSGMDTHTEEAAVGGLNRKLSHEERDKTVPESPQKKRTSHHCCEIAMCHVNTIICLRIEVLAFVNVGNKSLVTYLLVSHLSYLD